MSTGQSTGGRTTLSEINVTPLVDVMLVLLIIFMVTAPMIEQGVEVDLPNTETVEIESKQGKSLVVLARDGKIFLNDAEVELTDLEEKIRTNAKIQEEKMVYLYADQELKYERVARVMAILKQAGVMNMGMVTEPLDPAQGAAPPAAGGGGP